MNTDNVIAPHPTDRRLRSLHSRNRGPLRLSYIEVVQKVLHGRRLNGHGISVANSLVYVDSLLVPKDAQQVEQQHEHPEALDDNAAPLGSGANLGFSPADRGISLR